MKMFLRDNEDDTFTKVEKAYYNGYCASETLLEDVMFEITLKDNVLVAQIATGHERYFATLNEKYWLKTVNELIQDHDVFQVDRLGKDDREVVCYDDSLPPERQNFYCPGVPVIVPAE